MARPVDRTSPLREIARQVVIWLPVGVMLWAVFIRGGVVDAFFSRALTDCGGCLRPLVFKHDLPLLALLLIAQVAGVTSRSRLLSTVLRLFACSVLLVYFVDLVIFDLFAHRLNLLDVTGYGPEVRAIKLIFVEYIQRDQSHSVAIVLIGLLASTVLAFVRVRPMRPIRALIVGLATLMLCGAYFVPDSAAFVYAWSYRNVAEVQKGNTAGSAYSADFIQKAITEGATSRRDAAACIKGLDTRRNVIVVVMESLSSHHSKFFSGLADWTPNIDTLARQGVAVIDFYANGFSTSQGLVAVLTGHDPLPSASWGNSRSWRGVTDSLAFRLKRSGYRTAVLSNVDLDFLEARKFFQSIGFDEIEGYNAPAFDGVERFRWQAPADDALYQRVTRWVSEQPRDRPFFAFINTMSTHQPFSNPRTGETTEEAAFRYGDLSFGAFVQQLRDAGFFQNGVLFLTGDHRSMTPVSAAEAARFGEAAPTRTPLLIIGRDIVPRVAAGAYQQADLPPSIEYLVASSACFTSRQRNLFSEPAKAQPDERCIVHSRGDEMDAVDVFCGERHGRVRLDGDATSAVSGYVPRSVLDDINRERIGWFERRGADGVVAPSLPPPAAP
jgi:lipoteichoic acid synthase